MDSLPAMKHALVVATALKILLYPAYHSTDFEVHRNWLALTHSLPVREWYFEKTSEWTLDYPPFFAYFEYALSYFAQYFDSAMLIVSNLNYASWPTIAFQRSTVIVTELVLYYSLVQYINLVPAGSRHLAHAAALSILLSPGLLIIDHIHFQYNGMMYGLLILSLALARKPSTTLLSGFLFAVLLCFKHIYLYLAPAYFVFLLRSYCLGRSIFTVRFLNCIKLGLGLVVVFGAAFGPFVVWGQIPQLLSRLFPFARGLTHAYWAPNAWAIYSFVDRVLIFLAPRLGIPVNREAAASLTRGLVGDVQFAVLPEITSGMTFVLTLLAMLLQPYKLSYLIPTPWASGTFVAIAESRADIASQPPLIKLFLTPTWRNFISSVTLCAYASFLFGYHVHEKAILLVLLPFSLIALTDRRYLSAFSPLTTAGHVSLFPLLFDAETWPIKFLYTASWILVFNIAFERIAPAPEKGSRIFILDRLTMLWNLVAIPLIAYCSLVHGLVFGDRFEFLPLMFISTYCALGVVSSWVGFLVVYFTAPTVTKLEGGR